MKKVLFVFGLCLATAGVARGADAGDPMFPVDLENKARAEILYQNLHRGLDTGGDLEADVYLLRMHTDVGQFAYLDFDAGYIEPDSGSGGSFYGGVGLRFLAYDSDTVRISPYAQAHYAPDFGTDDMIDADAGLLFAYKLRVDDQMTVLPYAGPVLSIIRIQGDEDADEDNSFGAVAGLSLQMRGQNSIRFEAQFFDQANVSVAAGIAF